MNGENPKDLDWLDTPKWKALPVPADASEHEIKRSVKAYVRGCIAMYNDTARPAKRYNATRIFVDKKSDSPLLYTVSAFLSPFVVRIPEPPEGFTHLIPQEPTPPDDLT